MRIAIFKLIRFVLFGEDITKKDLEGVDWEALYAESRKLTVVVNGFIKLLNRIITLVKVCSLKLPLTPSSKSDWPLNGLSFGFQHS